MNVTTETNVKVTVTVQNGEVDLLESILRKFLIQNTSGGLHQTDEVILAQVLHETLLNPDMS